MGTFHNDLGELHGITVVVDTAGPKLYVGRCHEMTDQKVVLHDVDVHEDGEGRPTKQEYLKKAALYGVWKKHDQLIVPGSEVLSVRRLAEIEESAT